MKAQDRQRLRRRKARIDRRLDGTCPWESARPVLGNRNLRYEVSGRVNATARGGIGLVHEFVRELGLPEAIDRNVVVLKRHFPYHESDHVLNLTYNLVTGGTCIEDIEKLRQDEAYLEVLGAQRVPDPTTAGDFLRRFDPDSLLGLAQAMNEVRPKVWARLPKRERALGTIDVDGTLAPTEGECKEGMGISYKGDWGYHPLVVTLANTREVLDVTNRPGNETSHQGAAWHLDQAKDQVLSGGFERVRYRGDTAFSLTEHFDRWSEEDAEFVFGYSAHPVLVDRADSLPERDWQPLVRRGPSRGARRARPANVKRRIVEENGYTNLTLEEEHITEFAYQPAACGRTYRMIALRKRIRVTKGQLRLADDVRYFFYVTNVPKSDLRAQSVVSEANDRCEQENVIEQLKNGVHAMRSPSDGLASNGAWMLIGALAWNIKQWMGVSLGRKMKREAAELLRMEFRRFLHSLIALPCQIVRTGRRVVLRLLSYSPWARVLLDGTAHFQTLRRRC